jgi:hypothetical protein
MDHESAKYQHIKFGSKRDESFFKVKQCSDEGLAEKLIQARGRPSNLPARKPLKAARRNTSHAKTNQSGRYLRTKAPSFFQTKSF